MLSKQFAIRMALPGLLALATSLGVAPVLAGPVREAGPKGPRARVAPAPRAGLWSKATTVARFRGRWAPGRDYERFAATESPDEVLRYFARPTALALTSVALETGFAAFLRAKNTPGVAVPIPEKGLEVIFQAQRGRASDGKEVFQPTFTLRLTRAPAPAPVPVPPPPPLLP